VSRYKVYWRHEFIPGYKASEGYLRSVAVQNILEQEIYPGKDFNCVHMRASGCMLHYKFVLGAGTDKNRDKLIDPTVRVRRSYFIFSL